MSGVKRYDPNYAVISPADDLAVEAADGMFVMSSDYDALDSECSRLSNELANTELRALKYIHQCNARADLYRELKAERDELRALLEAMRAAIENAAKGIRWLQASVPMSLRISKRASKDYNAAKRAALQVKP